ncbi:hypothetical protein [Aquimarina sp. I32.4]|uniref:hypothetical protein n=1 Tax=Aquimarina sp. I32.4 TaxID=2053903 RepID=UPI000CDEBC0D|nr:hypothetical protein [Aquimarina sp. I32.4]
MPSKNDISSFTNKNINKKEKILPTKGKGANENAKKPKPERSPKTIRFRSDYQRKLETLAVNEKGISGKNVLDLTEEALELLFKKYGVNAPK